MPANRGAPTPPIALDVTPESVGRRLAAASFVDVDDAVLIRLRSVCTDVSVATADRVEHGRDWWPLTLAWALDGDVPSPPAAVARPASPAEVAGVLAVCHDAGVPVTPAAGRSGVCGAAVPVFGGVALDLCGLAGIVDVDDESLLLDVRPGTFGDVLEESLRRDHAVTLGHWPQSIALSTVGGWLACRSAGQYSNRYGKIEDMVVGLDVALADGTAVTTGGAPRAAVGPDLTQLFVGSEGTLGVITGARLRVHPLPAATWGAAFGFRSFAEGLDACRRLLRRGVAPAVLRLYDTAESARNFDVADRHVLLVHDEADGAVLAPLPGVVDEECVGADRLDDALVGRWFSHRNDVDALETLTRRGIVVDTIEVAGRWSSLAGMYDRVTAAVMALDGALVASAHQSHAYVDGACLYFTFAGQADGAEAREHFYRAAWDATTAAVLDAGGALSHHHGVGLNRSRYVAAALGPALGVLEAVKRALDPRGILNPGKLGLASPYGPPPWP